MLSVRRVFRDSGFDTDGSGDSKVCTARGSLFLADIGIRVGVRISADGEDID